MALVHTVILKPRDVIADAVRRFAQRPLAFWLVGFVTLIPDLRADSGLPTDLAGWQGYLAHLPSEADLKAQMTHSLVSGGLGLALSALAWPIIALLAQGMPVADLAHAALPRILSAARAFCAAVLALVALLGALLIPTLIAFIVTRRPGEPLGVPGFDALGFWGIALLDALVALLAVAFVSGAFLVVPAEACARPDTAKKVVRRSWLMCRDYLGGVAMVILWWQVVDVMGGLVTDALASAGVLGTMLSWALQAPLATLAPLAGASLHATLSENAASTQPGFHA